MKIDLSIGMSSCPLVAAESPERYRRRYLFGAPRTVAKLDKQASMVEE